MPVRGIFPIGAVDDGINTDAMQIGAMLHGKQGLCGGFTYPGAAAAADMAGFSDQHRPPVAPPHFQQQLVQRHAARFAQVPPQAQVAAAFPLVAVVVVQADQIQVARRAAQRRFATAAQHVPGLELRFAPGGRLRDPVGTAGRRGDMDQRVALQHARARIDAPDRLAAGDGGAHQLALAFPAGIGMVHVQAAKHMHRQAPAGKRDFIDRRKHRRAHRIRRQEARRRRAKARETGHEVRREQIEVLGPAIVAERPVDLQPQLLRHRRPFPYQRKIDLPTALGQAPADAFAQAAYAELA